MLHARVRACALAVAACGATAVAAGRSAPSLDATPFALESPGAIVIGASINHAGPFRLLVDTGSSRSIVSEEVARSLGLRAVAQSEVVTAAGSAMTPVTRLDVLQVGPMVRRNLPVLMVPGRVLTGDAGILDGVIGQDALAGLDYTIDYRHRRLTWDRPGTGADPAEGTALRLVTDEGRYLVELPQGSPSRPVLRLVPDSSATDIVLYRRDDHELALRPTELRADVTSITGRRDARLMVMPDLRVGALRLVDRPVIVVDRPASEVTCADGILPLHLFSAAIFRGGQSALTLR